MSSLLNEIIADLKARRIVYEEFLKRIADIARQVHAARSDESSRIGTASRSSKKPLP